MGEHKHNPTAIAARNGEIPPKKPKPSKREREMMAKAALNDALRKRGIPALYDLEHAANMEKVMREYGID